MVSKIILRLLLGLLALAALLAALAGWLLGSESGARWLLNAAGGAAVQLNGVHGRLIGPLHIEHVLVRQKNQDLEFDHVRLDWQPRALLQRELHLTRLQAERVVLIHKITQQPEAPVFPDAIALPLALKIDLLQVDAGEIHWGPVQVIKLGGFSMAIDFDGRRYLLQLKQFSASGQSAAASVDASLSGTLTLDTQSPYALTGEFSSGANALLQKQSLGLNGQLRLSGSLQQLHADLQFAHETARLQGSAVLQPFSTTPLISADLQARDLDLAAVRRDWPHTQLSGSLTTTGIDSAQLKLLNPAAGPADLQALPLRALQLTARRQDERVLLEKIQATLGSAQAPAGSVSGSGTLASGTATLALRIAGLDLHGIDNRLQHTELGGRLDLTHGAGSEHLALALAAPVGKQNATLNAQLSLADARIAVESAALSLGGARLTASGHVDLAGHRGFAAQGELSKFRPQALGRFAQLPALELNGNFKLQGALLPQLDGEVSFAIRDSRLAGRPLQGAGLVQYHGQRLLVPNLNLTAGANSLHVQGALAEGASQLDYALKAPQLELLGPGFGGALELSGTARGSLRQPALDARWNGSRLAAPGNLRIGQISGNARLAPLQDAPLQLELRATDVRTPQLDADSISMSAAGTTAHHSLQATLVEADKKQNWDIALQGGLRQEKSGPRWSGTINRLDASGRLSAQLAAAAPLTLASGRIELQQFQLTSGATSVLLEQFLRDANGITTRGRLRGLRLAQLLSLSAAPAGISTDLQFDGEWDLKLAAGMAGTVALRRVSGDLQSAGGTPLTLGLSALEGSVTANGNALLLQLRADGRQLGHIELNASANANSRAALSVDTPISGTAKIDIPSLAWIGQLAPRPLLTEGQLSGAMTVAGSFANPQFAGRIGGHKLRLFLSDSGIDLRDGELDAEFNGATLMLRQLAFQSNGGRLIAQGPLRFSAGQPGAQIEIRADKYPFLTRTDRKLVLSGQAMLDWSDARARLNGALQVDSGFFDIGREDTPELSDDVVILGSGQKAATPLAAVIDLNLNLGPGVRLQGRGLEGLLLGQLRLQGEPGSSLRANGSLQISDGTYSAYGRKLAIEQGVLHFNGPLNNPALDIVAMRRGFGQEVEAGVAVRGVVLAPRVTLVSEPTVPDAEKLSWLVLGHGLDTAGSADLSALQSAAGTLLSQGAASGVQSQLASAFGLDEFKIGSTTTADNLTQRIVTLGKRLSSRLYVSYQQTLQSVGSVVLLRYTLSKHLTVEAEAGTRSALSLFYNITFD